MKHRRDDKRRQSRARDGDSQTRDADAVRARQTPGERVSRAYERVKGRTQRDESHTRRDEPHIQRDESRTRRDELHIRRDKPHIQRDEPHIRRNEPRAGRDVHDIRHEESRARRDKRGGGAETSGARDENARRTRTEEDGAHVFGVQPVLEALRAGARPVERLTLAEGAHESRLREILEIARYADIPVRRVPRAELQRLAAGANHQGVVATIAAAHYTHAEDLLDALAARVGTNDPPLAVVLDGVEDPRNLGAVIRTMECAGAHGAFIPERRASGLTETVAKAAAGALEYVPVARAANVVRLMEELKGRGVWTVGTAADASKDYTEWDWTQPSAILLGGEGEGLRRLVRERCDVLVRVPLLGRIESLNVSVAAGIILYEAVRQRRIKKVISDE
jgi:23S rRNA (guanosine2251-2'-O)-methyltransferase